MINRSRNRIVTVFFVLIATLLLMMASTSSAYAAARCRDCPFPLKIGDKLWLMPDSTVAVSIVEQRMLDGSYMMSVTLLDSVTSDVLAAGTTRRNRKQRSVSVTLIDPDGRRITGSIRYVNMHKAIIQARFACEDAICSIERRL